MNTTLGAKFSCVNAFLDWPRKNIARQILVTKPPIFYKKGRTRGRGQSDREEVTIALPKGRCDVFTIPAIG